MIKSKKDYIAYLEADKKAVEFPDKLKLKDRSYNFIFGKELWRFQQLLRKVEYYKNCKRSLFWKPYYAYLWRKFLKQQLKLGFFIRPNCFGPGLSIRHFGTLIVNPHARIGYNCRIYPCVVIGCQAGFSDLAPTIGNNVYIGPGAKIFGQITIADGIAIGANAVVKKSFKEKNITIAGVPAKKISNKGSKGILPDFAPFESTV